MVVDDCRDRIEIALLELLIWELPDELSMYGRTVVEHPVCVARAGYVMFMDSMLTC
jgi:hypothetical protein